MRKLILSLIMVTGITVIATTLTSCEKEETKNSTTNTDVRDASVGTYSGMYLITIDGNLETDSGIVVLTKGPNKSINFGDLDDQLTSTDVVANGNDYAANINTQNTTIDGITYVIVGKGNNNEHLSYVHSNKSFSFDCELKNTSGQTVGEISFLGFKK